MKMTAHQRLTHLFDDKFEVLENVAVAHDPLKFKDVKKYSDRLKDYRARTGLEDTIVSGVGHVDDVKLVACVHDFSFAGGSLGMAAGEAIIKAFERAIEEKCPLVLFPASGGARMQEGILSLMQLPRTTVAVEMLKEAGLPYIVVLTNPTTGGVSASYAMLGDIHIAEPGAEIGFAGKRVIEQTIREKLPKGFQTSEYLLEHGMIDMVVHRHELPKMLARILRLFANTPAKLEELLALPAETAPDTDVSEPVEAELPSDEATPAQEAEPVETDEAKT